jgi:hypothetical protein
LALAMARMSLIQEVRVRVLDEEMRLYRACLSPENRSQLDSFRSHNELRRPPRGPQGQGSGDPHGRLDVREAGAVLGAH